MKKKPRCLNCSDAEVSRKLSNKFCSRSCLEEWGLNEAKWQYWCYSHNTWHNQDYIDQNSLEDCIIDET